MWLPGNTLGFRGEMSLGRSLNPEKWLKLSNGPVWGDVSGKQAFGTPQITCPGESHKSQSNPILSAVSRKESQGVSNGCLLPGTRKETDVLLCLGLVASAGVRAFKGPFLSFETCQGW